MHKRLTPVSNRFIYRVFSFYLDLDRIDDLDRRLRLFSRNRRNLFSFWDRDHGPRDGSPLRPWIDSLLSQADIDPGSLRVSLLCFPRLFGYAFNPLSIWFCRCAQGELRAVIYEVRNTFGEHHHYLFRVQSMAGGEPFEHSCGKQMYVSPFIDEEATYYFRLYPPGEKFILQIREYKGTDEVLVATQIGERAPLSDGWLARILITHPFMTAKVIVGIHWQAFRLWRRGVGFHSYKPTVTPSVSFPDKTIEQHEESSSA
jgi:DUF1365 family protein